MVHWMLLSDLRFELESQRNRGDSRARQYIAKVISHMTFSRQSCIVALCTHMLAPNIPLYPCQAFQPKNVYE